MVRVMTRKVTRKARAPLRHDADRRARTVDQSCDCETRPPVVCTPGLTILDGTPTRHANCYARSRALARASISHVSRAHSQSACICIDVRPRVPCVVESWFMPSPSAGVCARRAPAVPMWPEPGASRLPRGASSCVPASRSLPRCRRPRPPSSSHRLWECDSVAAPAQRRSAPKYQRRGAVAAA